MQQNSMAEMKGQNITHTNDDDPRTGTRITEVTNLDRGEPNPALFQVPEGYTMRDRYPGKN
jgi:hypothetical protein